MEINLFELRVNSSSLRDNSFDSNKIVQMNLSQVSQVILNWQVSDSDVYLSMHVFKIRIELNNKFKSDLVQNWKYPTWKLCNPNS
jgi:hypothetical protein